MKAKHIFQSAVFDIEVTDFNTEGEEGKLVAACVLPVDSQRVKTFSIKYDDYGDDRRVLIELLDELTHYTVLVGHNIARFDLPWLKSRMIVHHLGLERQWLYYVDTLTLARALQIRTRKGLGNLADYFKLDGEKTPVYIASWSEVRSQHETEFTRAIDKIVYHCRQDVRMNRDLFLELWPLEHIANQPQLKRAPRMPRTCDYRERATSL